MGVDITNLLDGSEGVQFKVGGLGCLNNLE